MRIFVDRLNCCEHDLDNPETYQYLPKTTRGLRDMMFKEIGYFHCYVTYFHPYWDDDQVNKVEDMIEYFCNNEKKNYENVLWYQEQVFLFMNETENMC